MLNWFWIILFDTVHHRGLLSTCYRPIGVANPHIYGPSAEDAEKMDDANTIFITFRPGLNPISSPRFLYYPGSRSRNGIIDLVLLSFSKISLHQLNVPLGTPEKNWEYP